MYINGYDLILQPIPEWNTHSTTSQENNILFFLRSRKKEKKKRGEGGIFVNTKRAEI